MLIARLTLCCLTSLLLAGCPTPKPVSSGGDDDGDGVLDSRDCAPNDAEIHPGADEDCEDGTDNDCDGLTDAEDGACQQIETREPDLIDGDEDGVMLPEDCDDKDPLRNPDATEDCEDGAQVDDDCDGATEPGPEDEAASGCTEWWPDVDGDSYGDEGATASCTCVAPEPGADTPAWATVGGDCDDTRADIYPGAVPMCSTEGADADCDGAADEVEPADCTIWYIDADADGDTDGKGYDGAGYEDDPICACEAPEGYVDNEEGCADGDLYYVDQDVDGYAEDAIDSDGDGDCRDELAASGVPLCRLLCAAEGAYTGRTGSDCDDLDPAIFPAATEVCDGLDNDCDGEADEAGADGMTDWYPDRDNDGYGDLGSAAVTSCRKPTTTEFEMSTDATDCDDGDAAIYPTASEICDEKDNDCDEQVDEGMVFQTYYYDYDNDGYGVSSLPKEYCEGYQRDYWTALTGGDCDDTKGSFHPGAEETCDYFDNDCNGIADDGAPTTTYYYDEDGDGYGTGASSKGFCEGKQDEGYVEKSGDCDDDCVDCNPGETGELCDSRDNDCDGYTDEGERFDAWPDADEDGLGDETVSSSERCVDGTDWCDDDTDSCDDDDPTYTRYVSNNDDCDDTKDSEPGPYYVDADDDGEGNLYAAAVEICATEGYSAVNTDCDDSDPDIYEYAAEVCDGKDNDCDNKTDDKDVDPGDIINVGDLNGDRTSESGLMYCCIATDDTDKDGFGDGVATTTTKIDCRCASNSTYTLGASDCNDTSKDINPAATEDTSTTTIDEDCDGDNTNTTSSYESLELTYEPQNSTDLATGECWEYTAAKAAASE